MTGIASAFRRVFAALINVEWPVCGVFVPIFAARKTGPEYA